MRRPRGLALSLALCTALGAPNGAWAQRVAGERPDASTVEGGLWALSEKAELKAKASAELNRDPALSGYVQAVACRVAAEYCGDIRVYVMDRPFFNASMAPNGYTEVWSGTLLRARDEGELAYVLGHEISHFAEGHGVEALRAVKGRAMAGMLVGMAVGAAGVVAAANAGTAADARSILDATGSLVDIVYLGAIASIFAFSRGQETEADVEGLRRAAKAGYDPAGGGGAWRTLTSEVSASEFPKVRRGDARFSIFSSHPLSKERIADLEAAAKTLPSGGDSGRERHRAAIRPHLGAWLRDDLRRRDFGQTLLLIDRLAVGGEDAGVLNFYRGEAHRIRGKAGDLAKARDAYAAASFEPDAPTAVWRALGDVRRKTDDLGGAQAAYETYLARAPEAEDAWLVRDALTGLSKGQ